jgi:DNA-binding NtrC family response regulator
MNPPPAPVSATDERPILLVDDERELLFSYESILEAEEIGPVICCDDSRNVSALIDERPPELVVLDLFMPHVSGMELLPILVERLPGVPVIIVTGEHTPARVVECMRLGAHDYLAKPVERDRFVTTIRNTLAYRALQRENAILAKQCVGAMPSHPEYFSEIVTRNPRMLSIFAYIEAIADSPQPILITGETGSGKELIARAIHKSKRLPGPIVPVNVAGLDAHLFSDTLFGHVRGAFTGADEDRPGLIEKAGNGVLFLDEIGDLAAAAQIKLLRLLQEREYQPLGSDAVRKSVAQLVLATNRNLGKLRADGAFREDLYFRLCTHCIEIPPLRERKEDIPQLVDHFVDKVSRELGRPSPVVPTAAYARLSSHSFPGNIRELEAIVYDAVSRQRANILPLAAMEEHLRPRTAETDEEQAPEGNSPPESRHVNFGDQLPPLREIQAILVYEALRRSNGNKNLAARLLGTTRQAINWHLKK